MNNEFTSACYNSTIIVKTEGMVCIQLVGYVLVVVLFEMK